MQGLRYTGQESDGASQHAKLKLAVQRGGCKSNDQRQRPKLASKRAEFSSCSTVNDVASSNPPWSIFFLPHSCARL